MRDQRPIHSHEFHHSREAFDERLVRHELLLLASAAPCVAMATIVTDRVAGAWDPGVALGVLSGAAFFAGRPWDRRG